MKAAEWSFNGELVSYLLSLEKWSVFSAMREIRMNVGSIDLDQEVDRFLTKRAVTFSEQGLIGVYFLTRTSPSGCS